MDNLKRNLLIAPFVGAAIGAVFGAATFGTAMMAPAVFLFAIAAPLAYIMFDMFRDGHRRKMRRMRYTPSPRRPKYVDWDYGRKDKKS